MECKFCNIKKREIIYETKTSIIREGSGFHHGHLQIILKQHKTDLTKLPKKEYTNFLIDLQETAKIVKKVFKPDMLNYELLGNWVPHLHWHIYPRYKTDPDYAQPPILSWKLMGMRVIPPRIELTNKPLTRKEKESLSEEFKKQKTK